MNQACKGTMTNKTLLKLSVTANKDFFSVFLTQIKQDMPLLILFINKRKKLAFHKEPCDFLIYSLTQEHTLLTLSLNTT